jgi:hypothetical protein
MGPYSPAVGYSYTVSFKTRSTLAHIFLSCFASQYQKTFLKWYLAAYFMPCQGNDSPLLDITSPFKPPLVSNANKRQSDDGTKRNKDNSTSCHGI